MTSGGPKGGSPFDDDLQSELDAWDATFDAIKLDGASASGATPFAAEDASPPASAVAADDASPFDFAIDGEGEGEGEGDAAAAAAAGPGSGNQPPARRAVALPSTADDFELAFTPEPTGSTAVHVRAPSEVGATIDLGPPEDDGELPADPLGTAQAIGAMLGASADITRVRPLPALGQHDADGADADPNEADDDAVVSSVAPPRARRATARQAESEFGDGPTRMITLDEELVATSRRPPAGPAASTSRSRPAVVRREELERRRTGAIPTSTLPESALTVPPARMATSAVAPDNIIDEYDAEGPSSGVVVRPAEDTITPSHGIDASAVAAMVAGGAAPDEDDYDVEISAGVDVAAGVAPVPVAPVEAEASGSTRRLSAHLVRRTPTGAPPLSAAIGGGGAAAALQRAAAAADARTLAAPPPESSSRASSPSAPAAEDDFSDVNVDEPIIPTDVPSAHAGATPAAPSAEPDNLVNALAGLDGGDDDDDADMEISTTFETATPPPTGRAPVAAPVAAIPATPSEALVAPPSGGERGRVKTPTAVPPMAVRAQIERDVRRASRGSGSLVPSVLAMRGEPELGLDQIDLPERVAPVAVVEDDEARADLLEAYERELPAIDDSVVEAAMRLECGRLASGLGDVERARAHFDAALLADPRCTPALRGLRQLARAAADWDEVGRLLEAELAVSGTLERRALALHRVDVLVAAGELDQARVGVGELLDGAPSDVRALLANLELAFLDGRADEFGDSLRRLADSIAEPAVRAAARVVRGHLAERAGALPDARASYGTARDELPGTIGALIGLGRVALREGDRVAHGESVLALARALQGDPPLAAALAVRAATLLVGEARHEAMAVALAVAPTDPCVAALQAALQGTSASAPERVSALLHLADHADVPAIRAAALAEAAERQAGVADADRAAAWPSSRSLWAELAATGDDALAAAELRRDLVASGSDVEVAALDRAALERGGSEREVMKAAYALAASGDAPAAAAELGRALLASEGVSPWSVTEARAELLAAAGEWEIRARLLAQFADSVDGSAVADLAAERAATAAEDAAAAALGAAGEQLGAAAPALERALAAWSSVLAYRPADPLAHAVSRGLAERLAVARRAAGADDATADVPRTEVLARALVSARPDDAMRAGLARLGDAVDRLGAGGGAPEAQASLEAQLGELPVELAADPRVLAARAVLALARGAAGDHAALLTELAAQVPHDARGGGFVAARLRAAICWYVAPDSDDEALARAREEVESVLDLRPELALARALRDELRRRAGDGAHRQLDDTDDPFADAVRRAEQRAEAGDGDGAATWLATALGHRPGDPLATGALARVATTAGLASTASAAALATLREADAIGDLPAKADAYEELARIDDELRGDPGSARLALEAALAADPGRLPVLRRLIVSALTPPPAWPTLASLRATEAGAVSRAEHPGDVTALEVDRLGLLLRAGADDDVIEAALRALHSTAPHQRGVLSELEARIRRRGPSRELATLQLQIAEFFGADDAAREFVVRAGETLLDVGEVDQALACFRRAAEPAPAPPAALAGWREAALRGQLWLDAATATSLEAEAAATAEAQVARFHLAAVILMDKAVDGQRAAAALERVLELDPTHPDAFARLSTLLQEHADHAGLAALLTRRLEHAHPPALGLLLHRELARLCVGPLGDEAGARHHLRQVLAVAPGDRDALGELISLAWQAEDWPEAARTLEARIRGERDPAELRTLHLRLGVLYADRLADNARANRRAGAGAHLRPPTTSPRSIGSPSWPWRRATGARRWRSASASSTPTPIPTTGSPSCTASPASSSRASATESAPSAR
jgi:tetratricopeptide (TPR) repeat protein